MDQGSLELEQIDAGAKFLAEFAKQIPVIAAFWLKASDEDESYLYVVSEQISGHKLDIAYGEVLRLAGEMRSFRFNPFRVKLIKPSDPLAKAALVTLRLYPIRSGTRLHRSNFGEIGVDEVYLYPAPIAPSLSQTVEKQ